MDLQNNVSSELCLLLLNYLECHCSLFRRVRSKFFSLSVTRSVYTPGVTTLLSSYASVRMRKRGIR